MASDEVVKELEREAYIALLRALFSNPRPEAFVSGTAEGPRWAAPKA
jgi:hypothetical protein